MGNLLKQDHHQPALHLRTEHRILPAQGGSPISPGEQDSVEHGPTDDYVTLDHMDTSGWNEGAGEDIKYTLPRQWIEKMRRPHDKNLPRKTWEQNRSMRRVVANPIEENMREDVGGTDEHSESGIESGTQLIDEDDAHTIRKETSENALRRERALLPDDFMEDTAPLSQNGSVICQRKLDRVEVWITRVQAEGTLETIPSVSHEEDEDEGTESKTSRSGSESGSYASYSDASQQGATEIIEEAVMAESTGETSGSDSEYEPSEAAPSDAFGDGLDLDQFAHDTRVQYWEDDGDSCIDEAPETPYADQVRNVLSVHLADLRKVKEAIEKQGFKHHTIYFADKPEEREYARVLVGYNEEVMRNVENRILVRRGQVLKRERKAAAKLRGGFGRSCTWHVDHVKDESMMDVDNDGDTKQYD
ncbi:hypothetical protein K474DRAFT_1703008 [Panus rudis PR-1116 ss-1]|nr:hypothetical protein K474DRAFT_1703008 [Panus rudis PR-1116 ss-1]